MSTPTLGGLMRMKKTIAPTYFYQTPDTATAGKTLAVWQIIGTSAAQPNLPAQYIGPDEVVVTMTGTLTAGANLQLPTASAITSALQNDYPGQTFKLRIRNLSAGAFAWTVTTNTGITLNGSVDIQQNAYRDFFITITGIGANAACTVQSIGGGTV